MIMKQTKLSEVPIGANFKVWGREFTVLDRYWDLGLPGLISVFVLSTQIECDMPFREDDDKYAVAANDFRDSTIRRWLNNDYLKKLQKAGAKSEDIRNLTIDLACTLGRREYGKDVVKVGLLTLGQYGQYYNIIPLINSWWWLATPWVTPLYSPAVIDTTDVWNVSFEGGYYNYNCVGAVGVRPALLLDSSLSVSWEYKEINELEKYSMNELIAEVNRRIV